MAFSPGGSEEPQRAFKKHRDQARLPRHGSGPSQVKGRPVLRARGLAAQGGLETGGDRAAGEVMGTPPNSVLLPSLREACPSPGHPSVPSDSSQSPAALRVPGASRHLPGAQGRSGGRGQPTCVPGEASPARRNRDNPVHFS